MNAKQRRVARRLWLRTWNPFSGVNRTLPEPVRLRGAFVDNGAVLTVEVLLRGIEAAARNFGR